MLHTKFGASFVIYISGFQTFFFLEYFKIDKGLHRQLYDFLSWHCAIDAKDVNKDFILYLIIPKLL
jgi:hypothetical protein